MLEVVGTRALFVRVEQLVGFRGPSLGTTSTAWPSGTNKLEVVDSVHGVTPGAACHHSQTIVCHTILN